MKRFIGVLAVCGMMINAVPSSAAAEPIKDTEVGTWRATSTYSPALSLTTFASLTVKVRSADLNETAGSVTFFASGGKRSCRARLVYLGRFGYFDGNPRFSVRFLPGAPKRARSFCRPSRSGSRLQLSRNGDERAKISIWHGSPYAITDLVASGERL